MIRTQPSVRKAGERVDWHASWIWMEGEARPRNSYIYARRTFELPCTPASARIHCSADSRYRLFVNGTIIGHGPVPAVPGTAYYDTYDIAPHLKPGRNCIAALVHHIGEGTYSYIPVRAGFICQAEILLSTPSPEDSGNEIMVVGTDDTWKVKPAEDWTSAGARLSKRLGFQEVYDARLSPGDWQQADFYDGNWQSAVVIAGPDGEPFGRLSPRESPYLVEEPIPPQAIVGSYLCPDLPEGIGAPDMAAFMSREELMPLPSRRATNLHGLIGRRRRPAVIRPARNAGVTIILDFGREVSGNIELCLSGWGGAIFDIGYSERLDEGRVKPDLARMRYTDRYIMRSGRQTWRSLGPRGFRYVQIDIRECPRPIEIDYIRLIQLAQPPGRGHFESSDKLITQIWRTGAYTARLVMQDTFIDSVWRERVQWWSDARLTAHVAYYTSGDVSLFRQGIRQIAASQREDGSVLGLYPSSVERLIPDYSALWIMSVWEYYAWTGDTAFLEELYPSIRRCLEWFGRFARYDGLLKDVQGDPFIDWADIDKRGIVTALNCLYYEALHRTAQIAAVLGITSDSQAYESLASSVRLAINRYLWSPGHGLYVDSRWEAGQDRFSPQTNILAVLFDIPDHYRKIAICRQLLEPEWQDRITTPYFASYFAEILCRTGFYQEALDFIRKRWGAMIQAGATTFWERFTPEYSLCHGWSTGPTRHLSAEFLGVRPVAGERKMRIAPQPADLRWARGLVPTPYGDVEVDWRNDQRRFIMHARIPDGLTAEVLPPNGRAARIILDGARCEERVLSLKEGTHELVVEYERPRPTAAPRRPQADEGQVEILPGPIRISPERPRQRRASRRKPRPVGGVLSEEQPVQSSMTAGPEPSAIVETTPSDQQNRGRRRTRRKTVGINAQASEPVSGSTGLIAGSDTPENPPATEEKTPAKSEQGEEPTGRGRRLGRRRRKSKNGNGAET